MKQCWCLAARVAFCEVWTGAFFIFFIAVAVYVMLNLVTAVIVENAFSDAKSEEKELAVRLEREKEEELEDLKQLLNASLFFLFLSKFLCIRSSQN